MTSDRNAANQPTNTYAPRAHFHGQQDAWQKARSGGLAVALIGCAGFWAAVVVLFFYLLGA